MARGVFNAKAMDTLKLIVKNRRTLTLKDIKEINQITLEASEEEEDKEEKATVLALDVGELFFLQRILHGKASSQ